MPVSNVVLESQWQISDIKCLEVCNTREERKQFAYYCPICMRYFEKMLETACCQNYICRLCVRDLQDQEQKKDSKFKACCPFGCQHVDTATGAKLVLKDVDPSAKIKRYSDSQYEESEQHKDDKVDFFG